VVVHRDQFPAWRVLQVRRAGTFEPVDDDSRRVHYRAGVDFTPLGRPFARLAVAWLSRAIGPTLQRMSELAVARVS